MGPRKTLLLPHPVGKKAVHEIRLRITANWCVFLVDIWDIGPALIFISCCRGHGITYRDDVVPLPVLLCQ